jgi:tetratricopeptide (TPR) repeat protein
MDQRDRRRVLAWTVLAACVALHCTRGPTVLAQAQPYGLADTGGEIASGDALWRAGRLAEALEAYRWGTRRGHGEYKGWVRQGEVLLALHRSAEAAGAFERALALEPASAADAIRLGDACRAAGQRACAGRAYVTALRFGADAAVARRYQSLHVDAFAQSYPFGRYELTAADFHPAERSGPALAVGLGNPFGALGAQLSYYLQQPEQPFALAPYASLGVFPASKDHDSALAVLGGAMVLYGQRDRWFVDGSFGTIGVEWLRLHGTTAAYRSIHGVTFALGREWMYSTGILLRLCFGVAVLTDAVPVSQRWAPTIGFAFGWKP